MMVAIVDYLFGLLKLALLILAISMTVAGPYALFVIQYQRMTERERK